MKILAPLGASVFVLLETLQILSTLVVKAGNTTLYWRRTLHVSLGFAHFKYNNCSAIDN